MFVTLKKSFEFCAVVLGLFGFYANSAQATDHWHYINPATCTMRNSASASLGDYDGGMNFHGNDIMCPIRLPDGATLVWVRFFGINAYSNGLSFGVRRVNYSTPSTSTQIIPTWSSNSTVGGSGSWYISNTVSITIDNENNGYFLHGSAWYGPNNSKVSLIEIYYTTP